MDWKFKDKTPEAVKAIEKEPEDIELLERPDGIRVARVVWRDKSFDEAFPKGFETWPEDSQRLVVKNAARKLKVKVGRAKWDAMANLASELIAKELKALE